MQKYSSLYTKFYIMYSLKLTGNGIKVLCSAVKKKRRESRNEKSSHKSTQILHHKGSAFLGRKTTELSSKKASCKQRFWRKERGGTVLITDHYS